MTRTVRETASTYPPRLIATDDAPRAIGPYSQAVSCQGPRALLFVSGQLPIPPRAEDQDGPLDLQAQFRLALENALAVVRAGGGALSDVVKTTVFLTNLADYDQFNQVYSELFQEWRPARSVVQVAALPRGASVEVELVAAVPKAEPDERRSGPGGDGQAADREKRAATGRSGRES